MTFTVSRQGARLAFIATRGMKGLYASNDEPFSQSIPYRRAPRRSFEGDIKKMRNLEEYPITVDEVINSVRRAQLKAESCHNALEYIGNMEPLLLRTAVRILERLNFCFHGIGKGL